MTGLLPINSDIFGSYFLSFLTGDASCQLCEVFPRGSVFQNSYRQCTRWEFAALRFEGTSIESGDQFQQVLLEVGHQTLKVEAPRFCSSGERIDCGGFLEKG